ncbi:hypothetical protein THMIRHAM_13460 [Thiomicrorhabdus immobilis]|uniref:Uncharacterized protein n=1 Tax=Thiomicrorhabdus immobilis TaxID=2791037 RepID=A0ABM7MDP9_9GAMM|nr:DUF6172 family protein [Thiomicrorhabdus immobilis]BCN93561.1 hypothetical protein THMIRHAM_13460 [Thiomicrorhabdus immobilis]
MKKTFKLNPENPQPSREVESIKKEVKKYLNRERKKALPKGAHFWDFDCKFGRDEATSEEIHVSEIDNAIAQAKADGLESFYLEIIAAPVARTKKPTELKALEDMDDEFEGDYDGDDFDIDFDDDLDNDFDDDLGGTSRHTDDFDYN